MLLIHHLVFIHHVATSMENINYRHLLSFLCTFYVLVYANQHNDLVHERATETDELKLYNGQQSTWPALNQHSVSAMPL